ncbi:MAG: ABC transporter permease, partial [Bacilli bacterium]
MKSYINTALKRVYASRFWLSTFFFIVMITLWEWIVVAQNIPTWILPRPTAVWDRLLTDWHVYIPHLTVTFAEAVVGLVVGSLLGMVTGVVFNRIPLIERMLHGVLLLSQNIPLVVLSPLLALWLGLGMLPKVVLVIFLTYFPVVLSTY